MADPRIGRYRLIEELTSTTAPEAARAGMQLFRGQDTVLDREVAVRLLDRDDVRVPVFLAAARAAALIEDRRLVRILDILEDTAVTDPQDGDAATSAPARVCAVVSEWAQGRTVAELIADGPLRTTEATLLVADVARGIAAGLDADVCHGRLRPTSVVLSDAGEVRVRGMAVDAALMGPLEPGDDARARREGDVDSLGSLLYLLTTGRWPGAPIPGVTPAPESGRDHRVLLPSDVRAGIPRAIDDLVSRSVRRVDRIRGLTPVTDASQFAHALGIARDHVTPVPHAQPRGRHRRGTPVGRLAAIAVSALVVVALAVAGWRIAASAPDVTTQAQAPDASVEVLTADVSAPPTESGGPERALAVIGARSFDPFGDDNGNGKADGRKGRENDEAAALIADGDETTAWTSEVYGDAVADGKGGVGVILDLGDQRAIRAAELRFTAVGSAVEVRVADEVLKDPQLWTLLAQAPAGGPKITLRAPRAVNGRYVLLWFPELPLVPGSSSRHQVSLGEARILG